MLLVFLPCNAPSLPLSDGAAVHGPKGPRQRAVDCGAGSGGQERSQHQVRDHYFLTYTRLVHSCVCVPFRGCPVPGPRPGVGLERSTPPCHLTGWKIKNKTSRPAPISRACPLHDDVWRCAVSLSFPCLFHFALPLFGPIFPPAGLAHDLWTQSEVHFCLHL